MTKFLLLVSFTFLFVTVHSYGNSSKWRRHHHGQNSKFNRRLSQKEKINVGIVGAGISGLYAALILQDLGVDYEIFEGSSRVGGRYFTYDFNGIDYADLGAVRLPKIKFYDRYIGDQSWSLVNYLNDRLQPEKRIQLIPFIFSDKNNILHYNGRSILSKDVKEGVDTFGYGVSNDGTLPDEIARTSPSTILQRVLPEMNKKLANNFSQAIEELLKLDDYTFADYIMEKGNVSREVVNWIEMFASAKGAYNQGMVDAVMLGFIFGEGAKNGFVTPIGGISKVTDAMVIMLSKKPFLNQKVIAIQCGHPCDELYVDTDKSKREKFKHVILTPTFAAMRDIYMPGTSFKTQVALRTLTHLDIVKVAFRFKERFWQNPSYTNGNPIFGGASTTDMPIRTVLYPSYADNCTKCSGSLVLYTFANDAKRLAALHDNEIKSECLDNLLRIHGDAVLKFFTGEYKIQRWGEYEFTHGAVPNFHAGHWTKIAPHMIKPELNGRLHFAGDGLSIGHGWSIAALNGAYRAVESVLRSERMNSKLCELQKNWGTLEEPSILKRSPINCKNYNFRKNKYGKI